MEEDAKAANISKRPGRPGPQGPSRTDSRLSEGAVGVNRLQALHSVYGRNRRSGEGNRYAAGGVWNAAAGANQV